MPAALMTKTAQPGGMTHLPDQWWSHLPISELTCPRFLVSIGLGGLRR